MSKRNFTIMLRTIVLDGGRITITTAAEMLRVGRPALSNLLNGKSELSVEMACAIEDKYYYSAEMLLNEQTRAKLKEYRETIVSKILPVRPRSVLK